MNPETDKQTPSATIRPDKLRALRKIASVDETRYVLNGVLVEPMENGQATYVATDGRRLIAWFSDVLDGASGPRFVIPSKMIDAMPVEWQRKDVKIESRLGRITITSAENNVAISGDAIEGNYPDWQKVFPDPRPDKVSLPSFGMFVPYFVEIAAAAEVLVGINGARMKIVGDSETSPLILQSTNFEAAIMPVRFDTLASVGVKTER